MLRVFRRPRRGLPQEVLPSARHQRQHHQKQRAPPLRRQDPQFAEHLDREEGQRRQLERPAAGFTRPESEANGRVGQRERYSQWSLLL